MVTGLKHMVQTSNTEQISNNSKLSIQISLSGLSFCILDGPDNNITELKEYKFEKRLNPLEVLDQLKALFENENTLNKSFSSVCVIHTNELSALVSSELFDENCLADYLKFNAKILKSDFIAYDHINEMVNVYVPYVNINNFIYDTFGSFTYKHYSTVLLETILMMEKNSTEINVFVHVGINHFEIIVVDSSNLILYNTFEFQTKEDFMYYILFTYEQLELNPETHELIFLGAVSRESELFQICYKYIRHVVFGSRPSKYKFNVTPAHDHSDFVILNSF